MIIDLIKPTVGPILKAPIFNLSDNSMNIWARADRVRSKRKKINELDYCSVVVCRIIRLPIDVENINYIQEYTITDASNDYTALIKFTDLEPGTLYKYQIGFFNIQHSTAHEDLFSLYSLNWSASASANFTTTSIMTFDQESMRHVKLSNKIKVNDSTEIIGDVVQLGNNSVVPYKWNFSFGSCRFFMKIAKWFAAGTGNQGDQIFESISKSKPAFFLSIGDQVYYDTVRGLPATKSLSKMRKMNRIARTFPHYAEFVSNTPIYEMSDDHDLQCNNTNYQLRISDMNTFNNGLKCYYEYQHYDGPNAETKNRFYHFDRYNCTFFVLDTRSQRTQSHIISQHQFDELKNWMTDEANINKIKFVVSPTPVVSQQESDSFYGYPQDQKRIVKLILQTANTSKNIFILTGDAHCARCGSYRVEDSNGNSRGIITEILSSGLVATHHDRGKYYNMETVPDIDHDQYDAKNNFPYMIDNTRLSGLKFVTVFSSECYPNPSKPPNPALYVKHLTRGNVIDNVYTNIYIEYNYVVVCVHNQRGILLSTKSFPLQ